MLAYSVKGAAEQLGISTRLIYEMIYTNELPHKRLQGRGKAGQGRILIPKKSLEQWLENNN